MTKRSFGGVLFNSKVLSVLLSIVLWVYVAGVRGPDTTKSVSAQVMATNVPQGYVLSGSLPTVTVTLQGPTNALWNVTGTYVTPTVDLRGRAEGSFIASIQVQMVGLSGVTVESVDPKEVSVLLERLQTATVPVTPEVSGALSSDLVLGTLKVEPSSVEVSGPGSLVSQVKGAVLKVALDKIAAPSKGNVTIAGDITAYDARGQTVQGVLLSPHSAIAVLPILDSSTLKTVPLLASTTGYPKSGYALTSAVCTPAIAMVTGPSAALDQLKVIRTEPVDISTLTGTSTKQAKLILPAGVSVVSGSQTVSCQITIEPVIVLAVPDVAVEVRGADASWKVTLDTTAVSVLVSGTSSTIMGLKPAQIRAYVDVSAPALSDGGYEVLLDGLPQGIVSVTVTPASVIAEIQKGQ